MKTALAPIHGFQRDYFGGPASMATAPVSEDAGAILWFTCSDMGFRVDALGPSATNFYSIQNLGNTVPAQGTASTSTLTSLWFALLNYDVRHLVVCGHVPCPILHGVVRRARFSLSPEVKPSFEPLMNTLRRHYVGLDPLASLQIAAEENVLLQLENLLTHTIVRERLDDDRLKLYGWLLDDSAESIRRFNPDSGQFEAFAKNGQNGHASSSRQF